MESSKGKMFINSPDAVAGNRADKCDTSAASFQAEENGCIDMVGSEDEILASMRELIAILPLNCESDIYTDECEDDLNRVCANMVATDPRYVLSEISDDHIFFETKEGYAKDMVTGFIKMNGMTVGAIANAPRENKEVVLTAKGCDKAAEFVHFCDAFGIPVLTLTNVNGFCNCKCAEKKLAKALANYTYALANATIAKVNLITGQAFGSAYAIMNSKSLGADLVYAWSDAKVGMMDASMAAKIMYPNADAEELKEKAKAYDELQSNILSAAARGYVDLVIDPADTRKYLISAFEMLYTKSI
jgi:acetyl-CoA carboxylase carboxyltransferase component